jgi:GATA-binding protein
MLASIPQHMDSVRSHPQVPDGLPRQPSAEDLDAAHQLISSAQAGREHLGDRHRDDNFNTADGSNSAVNGSTNRWSDASIGDKVDEKTSPNSQRDTSFLGHSCRLVLGVAAPSRYMLTLVVTVERRVPRCGGDPLQEP